MIREWDVDQDGSIDWEEFGRGAVNFKRCEGNRHITLIQHDLHSYGTSILQKVNEEMNKQELELRQAHDHLKISVEASVQKALKKFYSQISRKSLVQGSRLSSV